MYKYKALKRNGKRIDEHRLLMQEHLGISLEYNQVVHHIDGNCGNNKIANLQVMSRSVHAKWHGFGGETRDVRRAIGRQKSPWRPEYTQYVFLFRSHHYSYQKIASMFNMHRKMICRIVNGRHWSVKHD